jgi:hypothetical protein
MSSIAIVISLHFCNHPTAPTNNDTLKYTPVSYKLVTGGNGGDTMTSAVV